MLVDISIVYIMDPFTGEISFVTLETGEDYSEFYSNQYIGDCVIKTESALRYYFLQGDKKLWECPYIDLKSADVDTLKDPITEDIPRSELTTSEIGTFENLSWQYGNNKVSFASMAEQERFALLLNKN